MLGVRKCIIRSSIYCNYQMTAVRKCVSRSRVAYSSLTNPPEKVCSACMPTSSVSSDSPDKRFFSARMHNTASTSTRSDKVKVLYDGNCPLCVKEIKLLARINKRKQTLQLVDITQPDYKSELHSGITYEQAMEVLHVVDTDGKVLTKVPAQHKMYEAVGLGWLWSWSLGSRIGPVIDEAYLWFARNRLWLTGKNKKCDDGKCEVKFKEGRR